MSRCLFIAILFVYFVQACTPTKVVRELHTAENLTVKSKNEFLKVHIKDGSIFLLSEWKIDTITEVIDGIGKYYDYKRDRILFKKNKYVESNDSVFVICWSDISLLETNRLKHHMGNLAAITVVGVPISILTIPCIANPKSCFGSCPTFYTQNNGNWNIVAEGFSSSILPVFEKKDIDMLYWTKNQGSNLSVKLTNEAFETHVIRYARLMVFPQEEGSRTFSTQQGEFYSLKNLLHPSGCENENGNCLDKVKHMDHVERYSLTDSKNLAQKEEIIFSFNNKEGNNLGLVIGSRQTLLTTFLFYQGLAYSGTYAGYFASKIENGDRLMKSRVEKLWNKLGGIEIYLKDKHGKWEKINELEEMGPIATDVHLIKLPQNIPANARVKLRMTQGLWRIDYLALGKINAKVSPTIIHPNELIKEVVANTASLQLLNDTSRYLITYPGDAFLLNYKLPEQGNYEYFLESKGYYLEWMRDEWLAEQDLNKARFMFAFPGLFMRRAAKDFKKTEAKMEELFWGSRYVKN